MTRKKIFAFLSALTITASMSAFPASACECLDNLTFINDYPYYVTSNVFGGIVVETDGTELTMDMLVDNEIIENIQTFDEYYRERGWGFQLFDFSTDETAYAIELNINTTKEERVAIARSLMLEFDFIKDAHYVSVINCQQVQCQTYFGITLNDSSVVVNEENYPDFANMQVSDVMYLELTDSYSCNVDFNAKFNAMKEEGMKDWEIHTFFCEMTDSLNEKYGDTLTVNYPEIFYLESTEEENGLASSVWTSAGDSNSDGTVDSTDAAEMLISAAQIGTGADVAVTSAADVNADGELNAEDAAAVLTYAAVKGTGAEPSWVDILRK